MATKDKTIKDLQKRADKLQQVVDEKQKLLVEGKSLNTTEAMLQHQNQMLTVDNLDLKEKVDELNNMCEKYKKTIKSMAKRQAGGTAEEESKAAAPAHRSPPGAGVMANILRKETEFKGMLSYPREMEPQLIKNLILELKPKCAASLQPGVFFFFFLLFVYFFFFFY